MNVTLYWESSQPEGAMFVRRVVNIHRVALKKGTSVDSVQQTVQRTDG
jgi:hypothetical protein